MTEDMIFIDENAGYAFIDMSWFQYKIYVLSFDIIEGNYWKGQEVALNRYCLDHGRQQHRLQASVRRAVNISIDYNNNQNPLSPLG